MRRLRNATAVAVGVVLLVVVPLASAVPPGVSIDTTPANPTTATTATFGFSSPDTIATFACDLDGSSVACTSPKGYTGLSDGSHTFTVVATNAGSETSTDSYTWTVDTTPPSVPTISSGPTGPTNDATPAFGFSSSVTTNFCSIDNATPSTSCNGSFTASTLSEGPHTFYVTAADALGNTSAAATRSFTVDTTPPSVPTISSGPTGPTNDATPAFGFSSSVTTNFCSIDNATPSTSCNGSFTASTLSEGPHTFYVTAADALGNTSAAATRSFTVDTTPPSVPTISSGPTDPTNDATPAFGFSSSVTTNFCSIDNATPSTSCNGSFTASTLSEGPHTFYVTAADALGNTSAAATRSFTVDTAPPSTTISPAVPTAIATASLTISFGSTDGTATFACNLDSGGFNPCTSPASLVSLADGPHTFSIKATDAAGNVDPSPATATWVVDATPPVLTGPGDLSVEADGPSGTRVAFNVSGSDGGLALLPGAITCAPASGSTFPLGATGVTCTASDDLGNVGTVSFSVTVRDTTAPSINAPDASFTATDASGIARTDPAVASYLAGISASDIVSNPTLTTTAPDKLPIGVTTIVVTARDAAGNQSQKNVTLTVLEPGKTAPPPDFTPPGPVRKAKATAGDGKVVLTWLNPTAADLKSIRIVRSAVGSNTKTTVFTGLAKIVTNKGLKNGVAYRFELVALDKAGNTSRPVVVSATPEAAPLALPKPGTRVAKPPLLRWARVPSAAYFNIQLYRGGKKVLSAWPTVARLQLQAGWTYDKRAYTLKPGTYTWYVWPGVGARSAAVYGKLLGKSQFVVTTPRV